jgi:regulator of protease activity HflC (stomatin/prohibitin superfamily)
MSKKLKNLIIQEKKMDRERIEDFTRGRLGKLPIITLGVSLFIGLFLLFGIFAMWRSIRPGYIGIVFDKYNQRVTASNLEPGWAFINPFSQDIREYPVTIITYSMLQRSAEGRVSGDDSIKVQSNEGQQLNLDVVIQYQVVKTEAADLYTDWGGAPIFAVEDGVVRQYTRSQVPVVTSKYTWEEITSGKREVVVKEITEILTQEFKRRHLTLISFGIREVHLPTALQMALDQKIQAQQIAEQQRYQLKQAEVKAQQDVTEATGRANALKAQAEGEAQAILTRANAQSEANEKLSKTLTSELIRYQQMQKWDGKLPMVSSGATPFIDIRSLSQDNKTEK